jgi:hypothetical protein
MRLISLVLSRLDLCFGAHKSVRADLIADKGNTEANPPILKEKNWGGSLNWLRAKSTRWRVEVYYLAGWGNHKGMCASAVCKLCNGAHGSAGRYHDHGADFSLAECYYRALTVTNAKSHHSWRQPCADIAVGI